MLKNLLLHEVVFGSISVGKNKGFSNNRLVDLVRDRKKAGCGLQELAVQTCIGFGVRQRRECEQVVSQVIWDEDEGDDFPPACTHHNHHLDYDDDLSLEEYDAHYQIYGRSPWDFYDSDGY